MSKSTREKCCSKCKVMKPVDQFQRHRSNADGRQYQCKTCRRDNCGTPAVEKRCSKCNVVKLADQFARDRSRKTGLQNQCKACINSHRSTINNPITVTRKRCARCKVVKGAKQFCRDRQQKDGLQGWCYQCALERRRELDALLTVDERRSRWRKREYKLSQADYDNLLRQQNGVCACGDPPGPEGLHVDHDHVTGAVRGLLCGPCNRALGMALESPARLVALTRYLRRSRLRVA